MRNTYRQILKLSCTMLACILTGFILIVGVYMLPTDPMVVNARDSIPVFEQEGLNFSLLDSPNGKLDNFTDSFMVNNTIASGGKGALDDAMNSYRIIVTDGDNLDALRAYIKGEPTGHWTYGRYWHGYLAYLKPMFLILNYGQFRSLNMFFQILLMFGLCAGLCKHNRACYCLPLLIGWYALCPPAVMLSIQYSNIFYITFLAALAVLLWNHRFDFHKYLHFFLIVGAITSYIDLLTYPMLTILIPLTLVFVLKDQPSSLAVSTKEVVAYGASWGIGYGGMWAGKWVLATLLTDVNYFSDALSSVAQRTSTVSSHGDQLSPTAGLQKCLEVLLTSPVKLVLIMGICVLLVIFIRNRKEHLGSFCALYPYLLIAIVPVVWLILTCNHCYIHAWFTYRNLVATIFALFCGALTQVCPHGPSNNPPV